MVEVFEQSGELKKIIDSTGWTLFKGTIPKNLERAWSWEELEEMGPAREFETGNNYVFAPIPKNGESLRDAYSLTKGLGPSLKVEDLEDPRWAGFEIVRTADFYSGKPVLFTRLNFPPEFVVAFTPNTSFGDGTDLLGIQNKNVVDTFDKYFRIVTPEEFGLTVPIRADIPTRLADN